MSGSGSQAVLSAIASYLPEGRLSNADLAERFPDCTADEIKKDTGIESRCVVADDEFTSDLAVKAAQKLFALDERRREGIDVLILVTVSPDYIIPCTAPLVQHALGLPQETAAFDISLGCSGYTYGLNQAAALIESGRARKVLLITADRMSAYGTHAGRDIQTLFGDAGTASLIEASPTDADEQSRVSGGVIGDGKFGTDGAGAIHLWSPTSGVRGFTGNQQRDVPAATLEMNGLEVFTFSLRVVGKHVTEFLAGQGLNIDDVDLFVFHQANLFMIEHLRRRLKIASERFVVRIAEVGNTVSSTIPLALGQALEQGKVKAGDRVLLVGFGVGYSWGSVLLRYNG